MKAFISIDMEGIGGIVRETETDPNKGGESYQQSRRLMTQEGNAAIEGCVKAGGDGGPDRRLLLELRQPDPGGAARSSDSASGHAPFVLDGARPR